MLEYQFKYDRRKRENNVQISLEQEIEHVGSDNFLSIHDLKQSEFNDSEVTLYSLGKNITMEFEFNNTSSDFTNIGFTPDQVKLGYLPFRYSYFLYQVFDSYELKNQSLIHSNYIPTYLLPDISKAKVDTSLRRYEFTHFYIPNNIEMEDGATLYVRFYFFYSKTGTLYPFINKNSFLTNERVQYFPVTVNKTNRTYKFEAESIVCTQYLNEAYLEKINRSDKSENKSPNYPTGDRFSVDGTYS